MFSLLFLFQNTLISHILELSILFLSLGSSFCEKIVCDPLRSPREFVIIESPSCNIFFCLDFVPSLLCRGDWVERKNCVLWYWVVIPQWRSLCGRSCVDIVKILLCEGGNVEQWLESRNISLCLCLIFCLSTLNSLYLVLLLLLIYPLGFYLWEAIVCDPLRSPRESLSSLDH